MVLLGVLVWCLTGCTDPFDHPVPPEYQRIADELVATVESLPGVDAAEAPVFESDPKDHAGVWYISLRVSALSADGLNVIPPALAPVLEEASDGELHIDLSLSIPGGDGYAPSSVGDLSHETLQAVAALRARSEVLEVNGAMISPRIVVTVQPQMSVIDSLAPVRESVAQTGALEAITVHGGSDESDSFSVDVAPTWPSHDLAVAFDKLIASGIKHLHATYEVGTSGQAAVSASSNDPERVARVLESVPLSPDARFTRFSVHTHEEDPEDDRYIDGQVGVTT
jgi:hypothetical protein